MLKRRDQTKKSKSRKRGKFVHLHSNSGAWICALYLRWNRKPELIQGPTPISTPRMSVGETRFCFLPYQKVSQSRRMRMRWRRRWEIPTQQAGGEARQRKSKIWRLPFKSPAHHTSSSLQGRKSLLGPKSHPDRGPERERPASAPEGTVGGERGNDTDWAHRRIAWKTRKLIHI